jgi:hypothetical protein
MALVAGTSTATPHACDVVGTGVSAAAASTYCPLVGSGCANYSEDAAATSPHLVVASTRGSADARVMSASVAACPTAMSLFVWLVADGWC